MQEIYYIAKKNRFKTISYKTDFMRFNKNGATAL